MKDKKRKERKEELFLDNHHLPSLKKEGQEKSLCRNVQKLNLKPLSFGGYSCLFPLEYDSHME